MMSFWLMATVFTLVIPAYLALRPSWRSAWEITAIYVLLMLVGFSIALEAQGQGAFASGYEWANIVLVCALNLLATWVGFAVKRRKGRPNPAT